MPQETIEQRVQRLEDIEAIRMLKHQYCIHADIWGAPGNVEAFSRLFTETGELDVGDGTWIGPRGIAEGLYNMSSPWHRCIHLCMNPLIIVDGDKATGEWYANHPITKDDHSDPTYVVGIYDERYVRTADGWRFQFVKERIAIAPPIFKEAYAIS